MKIISFNVRGLGGWEKRREVRKLVNEHSPWVLCIQETKLQAVDDSCFRVGLETSMLFVLLMKEIVE